MEAKQITERNLHRPISQTALLPTSVQSLFFWGQNVVNLSVAINGQPISYIPIGSGTNYTIYGADVSAFAGQTGQLLFYAPYNGGGLIDNIQFSSSPIPEPGPPAVAALGGLLLGFSRWKK